MVSFGSKALPLRRPRHHSIIENILFREDRDSAYEQDTRRRNMGRKSAKKQKGSNGNGGSASGSRSEETPKDNASAKTQYSAVPEMSYVRKQIDPEMVQYFSEIANAVEGSEVDLEERYIICGNALEETRGKEVELSTDHIISHTIQILVDGCDADHLCGFLRSCAQNFAHIAVDRSGSHVAESALKSLAGHLADQDLRSSIKDTLRLICQAIVQNPMEVMCNCHGSHVLRSLLRLCKGVPLDSEFLAAKPSVALARRLNLNAEGGHRSVTQKVHQGFPDLLESLVSEMLKSNTIHIPTLQVDQYGSLVLQTALKLLEGQEQELTHIILVIMGCNMENAEDGNLIDRNEAEYIRDMLKENAFCHLMEKFTLSGNVMLHGFLESGLWSHPLTVIEVILEVAPDSVYDEIFIKVFKDLLFDISCHQSANFAVQSLISYARSENQIYVISEKLGPKFKDLIEMGRSGVVASLIAASQRLHAHENKCSKALASAVISAEESAKCIVPRILSLESYFFSNDKPNWSWTSGRRLHVMGSLILQCLFKYPREYIEPFITSLTSMETSHVFETAKDGAGSRVIEAFLDSNASDKQKQKLIKKLKGHFGELAMHPSGSFIVGKCFNVSDVSLREVIVSDVLTVQRELFKTKHGPHLTSQLDVDGFSRHPEQWKSKQKSKLSIQKDFLTEFGFGEGDSSKRKEPPTVSSKKASQQTNIKQMRKEIDDALTSYTTSDDASKHKKRKTR